MSAAAWTIEGLTARLSGRLAVDGASLTARPGEVVGVLGANGSGKTTLLRAGLGLIRTEAGAIRLGGEPLETLSEARRARLAGYLPQERRVSWNLAALEIVDGFGQRSLLEFGRFEVNVPVAAERFRFTPPPGSDVITQ